MKKYSFKRYAGVTMALFGAAALSLLLFFALFRIIYIIRYLSLLRMRRKRKACPII